MLVVGCSAIEGGHGMRYMGTPTYVYMYIEHLKGVMKCAVEAFKTCSNQGLTPTYLQKVGSIAIVSPTHI